MKDQSIELQTRLRSYRYAIWGAFFMTFAMALFTLLEASKDYKASGMSFAITSIWPLIAYICHLEMTIINMQMEILDK